MGLYPKHLTEFSVLTGIPRSKGQHIYIVDKEQGDDDNSGIEEFDALLGEQLRPPHGIFKKRIAAVNHDVAFFQLGNDATFSK